MLFSKEAIRIIFLLAVLQFCKTGWANEITPAQDEVYYFDCSATLHLATGTSERSGPESPEFYSEANFTLKVNPNRINPVDKRAPSENRAQRLISIDDQHDLALNIISEIDQEDPDRFNMTLELKVIEPKQIIHGRILRFDNVIRDAKTQNTVSYPRYFVQPVNDEDFFTDVASQLVEDMAINPQAVMATNAGSPSQLTAKTWEVATVRCSPLPAN